MLWTFLPFKTQKPVCLSAPVCPRLPGGPSSLEVLLENGGALEEALGLLQLLGEQRPLVRPRRLQKLREPVVGEVVFGAPKRGRAWKPRNSRSVGGS